MNRAIICILTALLACCYSLTIAKTFNVLDYGAAGDGKTDDTAAIQKALDAAGGIKGGTVYLPTGNYFIKTHLNIPNHVTLKGVWQVPTAWSQNKGSTLLAVEGAGSADGTPFITLWTNSTIKGITVFYPEQTKTNPPVPYPWTIGSGGADNCSIVDVLLVNPYQAVDFGTKCAGRHYIRNLYGQPLYKGLFIDWCLDVGRVENVHFWPFWNWDEPVKQFMYDNATGFLIAKTDWQYMTNCFTIGYNIGFHFMNSGNGPGNALLNTCGADVGPIAVLVDDCQYHSGISFSNSQMYGDIIIKKSNFGPVKFTGCGLFGNTDGRRGVTHGIIDGGGQVSFTNCHFITLDPKNTADTVLLARGGGLSVNGCDFMDVAKKHITMEQGIHSAVIIGNRFRGKTSIINSSNIKPQIGFNTDDNREEEPDAIVVDNDFNPENFRTEGTWHPAAIGGDYLGGELWTQKGEGEAKAVWTPDLQKAGKYKVFLWYGYDLNDDRATNAPVTVQHKKGKTELTVNLKENNSAWNLLGEFEFRKGTSGSVMLTNKAESYVGADAVKFIPAD